MSASPGTSWLGRGLLAGTILGALEAVERSYAVREFLRLPVDRLAFAALAFTFCVITGVALGVLAASLSGAFARASRFPVPRPLLWAATGIVIGLAAAAWLLFAFTLTVRFDAIVRRSQQVLAAAAVMGAVIGLIWPAVRALIRRLRDMRPVRASLAVLLVLLLVFLHLWNAHFAPQSSLGIHVLADTLLFATALVLAGLAPSAPRRRGLALALAAVLALLVWTDRTMRANPNVENLLKTRGSVSAHTVRMWSGVLDLDADGFAPALLVGGDDPNNLDASIPEPVLPREQDLTGEDPNAATVELRPEKESVPADAPHLILLTLDACRADVMPPSTGPQSRLKDLMPERPNLTRLEPRVARFLVGYTPSAGTMDTFAAMFSGWDLPGILRGVPEDQRLDQRLAAAGYEVRGYANDPTFTVDSFDPRRLVRYSGDDGFRMLAAAAAFLDSLPSGQPGFVWIHVLDLHADLLKPFAWQTFSHRAHLEFYARSLARVDSMVGDFVGALDRRDLLSRSVMVMTADHGEELGGHGHYHHNLSLYQPAIRVPLWIVGRGVEPGPRRARVSLQNVYPTLLEAAGLVPGVTVGRSMWPVLRGERPAESDSMIYSFLPQRGFSARYSFFPRVEMGQAALLDARRRKKVIIRLGQGSWEAYDVARDSLEFDNLAGSDATWPDSLRRQLELMIRERRTVPARRFPRMVNDPARDASGSGLTGGVQTVAPVRQSAAVKNPSSR